MPKSKSKRHKSYRRPKGQVKNLYSKKTQKLLSDIDLSNINLDSDNLAKVVDDLTIELESKFTKLESEYNKAQAMNGSTHKNNSFDDLAMVGIESFINEKIESIEAELNVNGDDVSDTESKVFDIEIPNIEELTEYKTEQCILQECKKSKFKKVVETKEAELSQIRFAQFRYCGDYDLKHISLFYDLAKIIKSDRENQNLRELIELIEFAEEKLSIYEKCCMLSSSGILDKCEYEAISIEVAGHANLINDRYLQIARFNDNGPTDAPLIYTYNIFMELGLLESLANISTMASLISFESMLIDSMKSNEHTVTDAALMCISGVLSTLCESLVYINLRSKYYFSLGTMQFFEEYSKISMNLKTMEQDSKLLSDQYYTELTDYSEALAEASSKYCERVREFFD